jgi:hypothetical protein
LRLGTLVLMNIEVPTKYPLSQERIVVFVRLHSKSPMVYRPALHDNWNPLSLARRALKDKFSTPTVPLKTVLQNRQVFLPDPVYHWFQTCRPRTHRGYSEGSTTSPTCQFFVIQLKIAFPSSPQPLQAMHFCVAVMSKQ